MWINQPVKDWPDFALSNEIAFQDTTFSSLANGFLINTGADTLAVSCKHLFMVFEQHIGLRSIDLGQSFVYWNMYLKNKRDAVVKIQRLINTNPEEHIGQFNSLKVRDWLIFEIDKNIPEVHPIKIRYTPIKTNEVVYAVGWGAKQKNNEQAAVIKLQCIKSLGDYSFTKTLSKNTNPQGRSGSPVIDKNGYLVGIVSGQEGTMGVIGNVNYLLGLFDKYKIGYTTEYN